MRRDVFLTQKVTKAQGFVLTTEAMDDEAAKQYYDENIPMPLSFFRRKKLISISFGGPRLEITRWEDCTEVVVTEPFYTGEFEALECFLDEVGISFDLYSHTTLCNDHGITSSVWTNDILSTTLDYLAKRNDYPVLIHDHRFTENVQRVLNNYFVISPPEIVG